MKAFNDCSYCYLKQMLSVFRIAGLSEKEIECFIDECLKYILTLNKNSNPSLNSSLSVLKAYEMINNQNPFKDMKKKSNNFGLGIYNQLQDIIDRSSYKLLTAFKIAVAGNIIDAGITPDFNIDVALEEIEHKEFDYCDYFNFLGQLQNSNNVLILGDNAGEIVFDKLLVKQLVNMNKNVTYAIKSHPTLNDAMMEDAKYVGMNDLVRIIETGSKNVGATLTSCSKEFVDEIINADIIIAKGQANYESLEDDSLIQGKIYFVLRAKCECIAKHLGVKLNNIVLKHK